MPLVALVAASLVLASCSDRSDAESAATVTAGNTGTAGPLVTAATVTGEAPSIGKTPSTPEELEQLLVAFAQCIEVSYPVVIRFRTDPYLGLSLAVGQRNEGEADSAMAKETDCSKRLSIGDRLIAYERNNPASLEDEQRTAESFAACALAVSDWVAETLDENHIDTLESIMIALDELGSHATESDQADLIGVTECQQEAIYGPERVFATGHPWFVP